VKPAQRRLIQLSDQIPGPDLRHGTPRLRRLPRPTADWASCPVQAEAIQPRRRVTDQNMNAR
jgi:hypothetical protein